MGFQGANGLPVASWRWVGPVDRLELLVFAGWKGAHIARKPFPLLCQTSFHGIPLPAFQLPEVIHPSRAKTLSFRVVVPLLSHRGPSHLKANHPHTKPPVPASTFTFLQSTRKPSSLHIHPVTVLLTSFEGKLEVELQTPGHSDLHASRMKGQKVQLGFVDTGAGTRNSQVVAICSLWCCISQLWHLPRYISGTLTMPIFCAGFKPEQVRPCDPLKKSCAVSAEESGISSSRSGLSYGMPFDISKKLGAQKWHLSVEVTCWSAANCFQMSVHVKF